MQFIQIQQETSFNKSNFSEIGQALQMFASRVLIRSEPGVSLIQAPYK